ncbi:hypothetical protein Ahy_A09g044327 isoform B [Arachis hypogaea]|uniref:C2H2-type domain-containing protein n=1 Tax=Arachis hypogaea TaxID=3818 RepID=A0A445BJW0_ARAHY|nr:hypothetical protein Ahy_A09g044327 isoform B [Arachis hypogaea]
MMRLKKYGGLSGGNALTLLIRKRVISIKLGGLGLPSACEVCSMPFIKKVPVHIRSHQKFLMN